MRKLKTFAEYLDAKGKLEDPVVSDNGDTSPEPNKFPPTAKGLADKPKPYMTATEPDKIKKGEAGLAAQGDKNLIYNPKTTPVQTKTVKTWPESTDDFLSQTDQMNLSEFTEFIINRNKTDISPVQTDDPVQVTNYVAKLASINHGIMETLVIEMQKLNAFDKLVAEVFRHQQAFQETAKIIKNEYNLNRLLAAMNESTDAPASETEEMNIKKKKIAKAAKPNRTKSVDGEPVDMGNSDVVTTRGN